MNFEEWFLSKQGEAYNSMYSFAKDAWAAAENAERTACAAVAFRHSKAHEQVSEKATNDADRDLAVNMSLAADAAGQAILARSNAAVSGRGETKPDEKDGGCTASA